MPSWKPVAWSSRVGPREPLKNVGEAASARQKQAKKRSLHAVNEHFEPVFNEALATQVIFRGSLEVTSEPRDPAQQISEQEANQQAQDRNRYEA